MFCHITQTWRGKPLISRLAVVELIAATTTKTGLTVRCELDDGHYPKAIKVRDEEWPASTISKETRSIPSGTTPSRPGSRSRHDAIIVGCRLRVSILSSAPRRFRSFLGSSRPACR